MNSSFHSKGEPNANEYSASATVFPGNRQGNAFSPKSWEVNSVEVPVLGVFACASMLLEFVLDAAFHRSLSDLGQLSK